MYRRSLVLGVTCSLMAAVNGCHRDPTPVAPSQPPVIPVSQPVQREVTDYVDFTGRTDAVQSVDIRARVTGYLVKMPFKEGAEVKTGDLLFEIDPRPYQAQLDQAQGQVDLYQAQLKLAKANLARGTGRSTQDRRRHQPAAARPGSGRGRRGRGQRQGRRGQPGSLQAEPRVHQGHLADRRPGQPLLPDPRQPGQPGPDAVDHGRLARPDVRLLRHGRADRCCGSAGRSTREGSSRTPDGRDSRPHGPAGRRRLPAPGDHQLRQQPGQPDHGQHLGAGRVPEPQAAGRHAGCCRPACSCGSGCRSASPTRRCW